MTINGVQLTGSYPLTELVIAFRSDQRPGAGFRCVFPVRTPGREITTPMDVEEHAAITWANFDEVALKPPKNCQPC